MGESGDTVVAVVERARLSGVLTAVHRGGYGHLVRVVDPERGEVGRQLQRAGIEPPAGWTAPAGDRVVVVVNAPARVAAAGGLLLQHGAETVVIAGRTGTTELAARTAFVPKPRPGRRVPPDLAAD